MFSAVLPFWLQGSTWYKPTTSRKYSLQFCPVGYKEARDTGPQSPENVFCSSALWATRTRVIQAYNPQKMFSAVLPCTRKLFCPVQGSFSVLYKEAWTQHCPQGATLAEKLRCANKADRLQTTKFINTIKPDIWEQSRNAVKGEESDIYFRSDELLRPGTTFAANLA